MVTLKKKSGHRSFLREEKKAKEALVIGLSKSYSKQTEVIFHLCFFFIVKNRAKRNFNNLFVRSFSASHSGGYASVRSTLAGFAEKRGICKRAKHPCRLRREGGGYASVRSTLAGFAEKGGYASVRSTLAGFAEKGCFLKLLSFVLSFQKRKYIKERRLQRIPVLMISVLLANRRRRPQTQISVHSSFFRHLLILPSVCDRIICGGDT